MNMMLYHNSANVADTNTFAAATGFSIGPGWSISYSDHLVFNDPFTITVVADDGTKDVFTWNDTIWQPPFGVHDRLEPVVGTNFWRLTHKNQSYHEFERTPTSATVARLKRVVDATGLPNALTLTYSVGGVLEQVMDAGGRPVTFTIDSGVVPIALIRITDPREEDCGGPFQPECTIQMRFWSLSYDTNGRLEGIRDPMFDDNAFTYDANGHLLTVSDKYQPVAPPAVPDIDWYGFGYESGGRLNWVLDPVGGLTQRFTYCCAEWLNSVGSPIRELRTYYTDRRGNVWLYKYGGVSYTPVPTAYLQEISSPLNGLRTFRFDADRNLLYFCEFAAGAYNCWDSTYDSNGNRLTLTDPLNHVQSWTYGAVNNVTSYTDAAGNVTQFKYETSVPTLVTRIIECPVAVANPGVNECPVSSDPPITTMAYYLGATDNGRGQLKEVVDPNGVWAGFEYDGWGQRKFYREGKIGTQTASPAYIYVEQTNNDSGGRTVSSSSSGGGEGSTTFNPDNQPTDTECLPPGLQATEAASPLSPLFPPIPCPGTAATLPEVSAAFSGALYSPKGELTELALDLTIDPPGLNNEQYYTRTHTATFDGLGRQTDGVVTSNEYGTEIPRPFTYEHDWAYGTYTRNGPDNVQTFVQIDADNRVQFVRRGPAEAPLMTASYTYLGNDLVRSVTYGNLASTWYTYDAARRVTRIEHRASGGSVLLALDYLYTDNDLPVKIYETGSTVGVGITTITTTFAYDRLQRLTQEQRCRGIICNLLYYDLEYWYDKGGNRIKKIDNYNGGEVDYTYDVSNPSLYVSFNNRLMQAVTLDAVGATLSTSWYYYTAAGNVDRVVTREEPTGGALAAASSVEAQGATVETTVDGGAEATALAAGGGTGCTDPLKQYTATRFGYAKNGAAVTYALGEQWCWDGVSSCPANYIVNWAREFRYDGARARYMNRSLDPVQLMSNSLVDIGTVWSDYDGDEIYGDFEMVSGSPVNKRSFEPGIGRTVNPLTTPVTNYYHGDMLGTTRLMTNSSGSSIEPAAYTAFGERISAPTITDDTRYGYVGAWGYQAHDDFPYLHVGARYYDPSSGRFLQRDPIGIKGGLNVHAYVANGPTTSVDPDGLWGGFVNYMRMVCSYAVPSPGPELAGALEIGPDAVRAILEEAPRQHIIEDHPENPQVDPNCPKCQRIQRILHPPPPPPPRPPVVPNVPWPRPPGVPSRPPWWPTWPRR